MNLYDEVTLGVKRVKWILSLRLQIVSEVCVQGSFIGHMTISM